MQTLNQDCLLAPQGKEIMTEQLSTKDFLQQLFSKTNIKESVIASKSQNKVDPDEAETFGDYCTRRSGLD